MATCLAMDLVMHFVCIALHFVCIAMHFAVYVARYLTMRIVSYIMKCMEMCMTLRIAMHIVM